MLNNLQVFQISCGEGIHSVRSVVTVCGNDINVCCGGGDTYHIGAVALAVPRPSLADAFKVSASASVLCVTSHKEDEIARMASLRLATKFNARVSVACGLHIDNATQEDIDALFENYLKLIGKIELMALEQSS